MKYELTSALKLLSLVIGFVLPSLAFADSSSAVEIKYFWRVPYIYYSVHGEYLRNPDGTIWTNPITGEPKYEIRFDPPAVNGVTKIGVDFSFNPSRLQIDTNPSAYGFLCNFSLQGTCASNPPVYPVTYNSPLQGSSWSFNVDNITGRATFAYDFSSTPVDITTNTDFFAFQVNSLVGQSLSTSDIHQNYTSSKQYCKTTESDSSDFSNNCGEPVPEPSTILGIGAILGVLPVLKKDNTKRKKDGDA